MDTNKTSLVILGMWLFINSAYSIPAPNEKVKNPSIKDSNVRVREDGDNSRNIEQIEDRISSIADSTRKIVENLLSTLRSSVEIITSLVDAKIKIAEPLLQDAAKTLETLSSSNGIERSLETVKNLADKGIQASVEISDILERVGSSTNPVVVQGISAVNEITASIVRLGICRLICPLQTGTEKKTCQNNNCENVVDSDVLVNK